MSHETPVDIYEKALDVALIHRAKATAASATGSATSHSWYHMYQSLLKEELKQLRRFHAIYGRAFDETSEAYHQFLNLLYEPMRPKEGGGEQSWSAIPRPYHPRYREEMEHTYGKMPTLSGRWSDKGWPKRAAKRQIDVARTQGELARPSPLGVLQDFAEAILFIDAANAEGLTVQETAECPGVPDFPEPARPWHLTPAQLEFIVDWFLERPEQELDYWQKACLLILTFEHLLTVAEEVIEWADEAIAEWLDWPGVPGARSRKPLRGPWPPTTEILDAQDWQKLLAIMRASENLRGIDR